MQTTAEDAHFVEDTKDVDVGSKMQEEAALNLQDPDLQIKMMKKQVEEATENTHCRSP